MSIIISTNVDVNYLYTKHHECLNSFVKHVNKEYKILLMGINNNNAFDSFSFNHRIDKLIINVDSIKYSKHLNLKNRNNFICLESGEFLDFYSFDEDDILILCDWDVIMQRKFTAEELNIISNLNSTAFGMNKDHYPKNLLYGYLGFENIFDDI